MDGMDECKKNKEYWLLLLFLFDDLPHHVFFLLVRLLGEVYIPTVHCHCVRGRFDSQWKGEEKERRVRSRGTVCMHSLLQRGFDRSIALSNFKNYPVVATLSRWCIFKHLLGI